MPASPLGDDPQQRFAATDVGVRGAILQPAAPRKYPEQILASKAPAVTDVTA